MPVGAPTRAELKFLSWLILECGYFEPKLLARGRYACIYRIGSNHAVVMGYMGDEIGHSDRWCYHDFDAAQAALDAWDGEGEPQGWHRHPASGRRRSTTPQIDMHGNLIPAGELFIRP